MIISYITGKKARCKIQNARHENQDISYFLLFLAFCFLCLTYFYIGSALAQNYEEQDLIPPSELKQSFDPDAKSYSAVSKSVYWEHQTSVDISNGNQSGIQMDYKEAIKYLNEATQLDPRSSFLQTKVAEVSMNLNDYETAKSAIKTAIELNPSNANAYYLGGYIKLKKDQDKQGALAEFKKATELNPELFNAQRSLGYLALDAGDYKIAANAYSQVVKLRPYESDYRYRLGFAYTKLGEINKAIEEFRTTIMLNENDLEARLGLAKLYSQQSQNKEAIAECIFILKRVQNNYNTDVMLLLAQLYVADGEYDKAISISESILKGRIGKNSVAEAYYRSGIAYKEKGEKSLADANFQKSIDTYKNLMEEDSKNIDLNYSIAVVYDSKGDYDLAEKHLQRFIVLKPDQPDAYNYLGYMLVEQNKDLEKAVTLIEKAIAMEPNNGVFRDSLGWAYFKLGKLDEAVAELEKSVELTPYDGDIHEHLGEAYFKKGGEFTQKAIQEWEKAIELKPKKTTLRQKLSDLQAKLISNTKKLH